MRTVGCTLRRLVEGVQGIVSCKPLLVPHQLGFGTPQGPEAVVYASRIYLRNMEEKQVMLKLDFRNAFNCLRRDKMLSGVSEKAPKLLPLVHSAYSSPSSLFIGDSTILSSEGFNRATL